MEALTFKLEDFEGPLDLLLYLVSKNKMNPVRHQHHGAD